MTPARALGLVHLPLSREDRKLKVALEAPAKTVPSTPLPIKVKVPQLAGNRPTSWAISWVSFTQPWARMDKANRAATVRIGFMVFRVPQWAARR